MTASSPSRAQSPVSLLRNLDRIRSDYGEGCGRRKLGLLRELESCRLASARSVLLLHETLCFLRAYPDDRKLLAQVERMLGKFSARGDLRRHAKQLADTGIAGTAIHFAFFWLTAAWLVGKWPGNITIDWDEFEEKARIVDAFPTLLLHCESPAYDEVDFEEKEWLEIFKGPDETDATFLIRRFEKLRCDSHIRELLFEALNLPLCIAPGPDTPTRTRARYDRSPVIYQKRPPTRTRPDLARAIREQPRSVREVSTREGHKLIDLARESMITRSRDLDCFIYADPGKVRMVDYGDGLQFASFEYIHERRLLLESVHGFLTLRNGVPLGYVLCSTLFNSSEIAYNVFDTYRGEEAARVYGRVLAMLRTLFDTDVFSVDPFQLGKENKEGLESGAWWFYYKLGLRPVDREVKRVLRGELEKMKRKPKHRSSLATLRKLSQESLFYFSSRERKDVIGILSLGDIGLRIIETVAGRFGADRERAEEVCSGEAAVLLGVRSLRGFSVAERLVWRRWGPLVMTLPGVRRWSAAEKRDLLEVIRAKAGRHESDFVRLFDRHKRLREAVLKLAE